MKKTNILYLSFIIMALLLSSCSKDDNTSTPSLDKTEVTLYVEETISLTYSGDNCIWTSDNPLIASVENGIITANHVGETLIYANDAQCKVTVKPHYTRYYEPYITWEEGKEKVKQYMNNYEIETENNNQIVYRGNNSVLLYAYTFENSQLTSSAFATDLLESSYLIDFILERYIPVSNEENTFTFFSPDKKTGIGLQINSSYILIMYIPFNFETNSKSLNIQDIHNKINQTIENCNISTTIKHNK